MVLVLTQDQVELIIKLWRVMEVILFISISCSTNDSVLEEMKKNYMLEQEKKNNNRI